MSETCNINGVEYVTASSVPPQVGDRVGMAYFVRTVTFAYTGRVVSESDTCIVLNDAAWIADSGILTKFVETGETSEVEVYPSGVRVEWWKSSIVESWAWPHALPRNRK